MSFIYMAQNRKFKRMQQKRQVNCCRLSVSSAMKNVSRQVGQGTQRFTAD